MVGVGGFDVKTGRDDGGQPVSEQLGQLVCVHSAIMVAGMETEESPVPTPRYSKVVKGSVQVASEMGHSYVGVEHLFLAVIRERAAVPTQVLAGLIDLDQVEAALLGEMGSAGYRGQTPPPSTQ